MWADETNFHSLFGKVWFQYCFPWQTRKEITIYKGVEIIFIELIVKHNVISNALKINPAKETNMTDDK